MQRWRVEKREKKHISVAYFRHFRSILLSFPLQTFVISGPVAGSTRAVKVDNADGK
jgi:hypothetical protein